VEGARCSAARPLPAWVFSRSRYGARRFTTPTDSVAAARSNVAPEMFRAITRTVLFDHTAALSSMNRVEDTSDACARSPARAPLTVTSISDVAPWRQARQVPGHLGCELPLPQLRQQRRAVQHRGCRLWQPVEPEGL